INGADARNNRVQGNVIGLDNLGRSATNFGNGVSIIRGNHNTIGGTSDTRLSSLQGEGNVISNNNQSGVRIENGSLNLVAGNFIGTDKSGADNGLIQGNRLAGVAIV